MRFFKFYLLSILPLFLFACSDDDDGTEFMFDREISEVSVLTECAPGVPEGTSCFKIQYRNPILTENSSGECVFSGLRVWLDTTVVDDTSKTVSSSQKEKADTVFDFSCKNAKIYDTIDVTSMVQQYIKEDYDSLQIVMFCEYSDGGDPGSVQHLFLHFGDDQRPGDVKLSSDSIWSTGAWVEWYRPTDRTDFYTPEFISGPIFGYNVFIEALDSTEDIRNLTVMVQTPAGTDLKGEKLYKRHARILSTNDSLQVKSAPHEERDKRYLRLVVFDGEGYDVDNAKKNRFRLSLDGLRTQSNSKNAGYSISIKAFDISGKASYNFTNKIINTTDSIAPLMPTKIFTVEDSLFPGFAKLDSNNRLVIFWDRSVDPLKFDHGIKIGSIIDIPGGCFQNSCYNVVTNYEIEYQNKLDGSWNKFGKDGHSANFEEYFKKNDDGTFAYGVDKEATFVSDTIRWMVPGDTLILRVRSVDDSKYYSVSLVDTIFVSPGKIAENLNCPAGFVPVSVSDTLSFCMERFEHRDAKGKFVTNVLHSEAEAACADVSADGFEVSLCRERDWELVCLSGGSLAYGVIEDNSDAADYLHMECNVGTNDSTTAADVAKRSARCVNPMGVRDLPGQYQEWVRGRSEDTVAVLKGSSYKVFEGLDRESIAYCTNRSFPFYTRPGYTQDTVYLYREGTKVDTVYAADTVRTLYKMITKKDFKDTLQFYDVKDASGKVIGTDYSLYSEYKKGGSAWLDSLANGLTYKPSRKEAVFLTGEKIPYRNASAFYKSPTIGFRCCAYRK